MDKDRVQKALLQAYRWIIAGIAGSGVGILVDAELPAFAPSTWVFVLVVMGLFLAGATFLEYLIDGQLDSIE